MKNKHSSKPEYNSDSSVPSPLVRHPFDRDPAAAQAHDRSAPASGAATPDSTTPPEHSNTVVIAEPAAGGDARAPVEGPPPPPQPTAEELQAKFEAEFRPYQRAVFQDQSTGILILHWARQTGKTHVLAAWAVQRLLLNPGRLVVVLSNSKENGAEFAHKCGEITHQMGALPEIEDLSPDLSYRNMRHEVRITVQGKVGRIKVLAANPRTARGFTGDLILDEFAFHEDSAAIWGAAEPFFSSNRDYLCRISSTGNGRHNAFYRLASGVSSERRAPALRESDSPNAEQELCAPTSEAAASPSSSIAEVAQTSQSAVSRVSQPAAATPVQACSNNPCAADLEIGDTAGLETCATSPLCPSSSSSSLPSEGGSLSSTLSHHAGEMVSILQEASRNASKNDAITALLDSITKCEPNSFGGYYLAASGYPVSCVTRSAAHIMGVPVFDPVTRAEITPGEARARALDKQAYDQNYECIFADENMTLLSHALISAAERSPIMIDDQAWSSESVTRMALAKGDLQVGNDIGRNRDLSVVTVIERDGDLRRVIGMLRMQGMRGPDQRRQLEIVCRMPKFKCYCGDMTGLGTFFVEELQGKFGASRIHGVNFAATEPVTEEIANEGRKHTTARVTEIMAMNLVALFEDRRIEIPTDPQLRDDLRKPERITSPGGRVSIAATRDEAGHADAFWSLALAVRAGEKARVPFEWSRVPVPEHMKPSSRLFMYETWEDYRRDDRRGILWGFP